MSAGANGKAEIPDETKSRQRQASDPAGSAWVSANAGSGKTYVLSRRVIRLLLAGTPASKLLCLTYTKAAAATMSNRVFDELARWAIMDDAALTKAITEMEAEAPSAARLEKARRLFAEAIETPGGLKIQTIHAFCEAILHQFPLEADLPGRFEVLDDAGKADLLRQAQSRTLLQATTQPETPLGAAFALVVDRSGEFGYREALATMIAKRGDFRRWIQAAGTLGDALAELKQALGLRPADATQSLEAEVVASPHLSPAYLADLAAALSASGSNDQKQGRLLAIYLGAADPAERVAAWRGFLFKRDGEPKAAKSLITKAIAERFPDCLARFEAETGRMAGLLDRLAAADTYRFTAAVLILGDAVIGVYEQEKRSRGALDFDDLIERTVNLLDRSSSAAWVQFKLDKGIDHILVDEAQDTSPAMWTIVERLAEEFFAGLGQRPTNRTLFAVGDEKQSIYSFQGAAPDQFSQKRLAFAERARHGKTGFADIKLYLSFRSTPDVLAAVDQVFAGSARVGVVARPEDYEDHRALRALAPGHVEIWPMLRDEKIEAPDDWAAPLDVATAASSVMRLADRVADEIGRLIDGSPLAGTGAPVRPRDILILVRSRHGFVAAVNRVLKDRGIPVAGADRLTLTDHIAVEDLVALGRVMLIADDDLSLAAVLKSPLFGWDDAQLFAVAHGRDEGRVPLWSALAQHAQSDPAARLAYQRLADWRARADQMPPYEFFARILGADGGRRRFVARLGSEADDVLDEFLAHALAQDRAGAGGLAGFLAGLEAAQPVIKREMDETRDEVRVMTVHGAKGLEAPIVFLVDAGSAPVSAQHAPRLVTLPVPGDADADRPPALGWVLAAAQRPAAVETALAADRARGEEEYRRLLYVAMTRAADRLYVCGYTKLRAPNADCWHQVIERSLLGSDKAVPRLGTDGEPDAHVWRSTDLPPLPSAGIRTVAEASVVLPDWAGRAPPSPPAVARLTPSTALDEIGGKLTREPLAAGATLASVRRPQEVELLRGTLVHKLLEALPDMPAIDRGRAAERYLARAGASLEPEQRATIIEEVGTILADPDFAALFAAGSRAEVPIVGTVATLDGRQFAVSGQIDRLAVTETDVLILDYKTNRQPPREVPESYRVQMALYGHLLSAIFPKRRIRASILWTVVPRIVEIPAVALMATARDLSLL